MSEPRDRFDVDRAEARAVYDVAKGTGDRRAWREAADAIKRLHTRRQRDRRTVQRLLRLYVEMRQRGLSGKELQGDDRNVDDVIKAVGLEPTTREYVKRYGGYVDLWEEEAQVRQQRSGVTAGRLLGYMWVPPPWSLPSELWAGPGLAEVSIGNRPFRVYYLRASVNNRTAPLICWFTPAEEKVLTDDLLGALPKTVRAERLRQYRSLRRKARCLVRTAVTYRLGEWTGGGRTPLDWIDAQRSWGGGGLVMTHPDIKWACWILDKYYELDPAISAFVSSLRLDLSV